MSKDEKKVNWKIKSEKLFLKCLLRKEKRGEDNVVLEEGEELGCLAFQLNHSPITHAPQRNRGSLGGSKELLPKLPCEDGDLQSYGENMVTN